MENSYKFFANKQCRFYPCHKGIDELNCLFCYCPLYSKDDCPGTPSYKEKNGCRLKVCTNCTFPHEAGNYDDMMKLLRNS